MYFKLMFFCIFLSLVSANHIKHKPIIRFAENETENIVKAVLECAPTYNLIPATLFTEVREGTYEITRAFKEFIHCAFKKAGHLRDDTGHINVDKVYSLFPKEANLKDIVYTCSNEDGEDAADTTFKFFKCFQEKSPVGVKFA